MGVLQIWNKVPSLPYMSPLRGWGLKGCGGRGFRERLTFLVTPSHKSGRATGLMWSSSAPTHQHWDKNPEGGPATRKERELQRGGEQDGRRDPNLDKITRRIFSLHQWSRNRPSVKDGRRGRGRGGDSVPANGESCLASPPGEGWPARRDEEWCQVHGTGEKNSKWTGRNPDLSSSVSVSAVPASAGPVFCIQTIFAAPLMCCDLLISGSLETW